MEKEILNELITEELVMDKENLEEIIEVGCDDGVKIAKILIVKKIVMSKIS